MRAGIDLGGTKIEIIVLDEHGQPLLRRRTATPANDYRATLRTIVRLVQQSEQQLGRQCRLGLCIPGALSPDNGRVKNANSVCLIGQRPDADLAELLQRPIRIANDADCFALSEATDGAGANAASVFGVILGTGVGGGVVINGRLLSGPNRIAGEWGHNPLPWPGPADQPATECYCGRHGCIETYLSGPGLCNQHHLRSGSELSCARQLSDLAAQGDTTARHSLDRYCDQLARSLATVINIIDPEVIVLGGGLSNIDRLYTEIPRRWSRYVFSDQVNTRLLRACHGDSSGVRGAAWLWPPQTLSEPQGPES